MAKPSPTVRRAWTYHDLAGELIAQTPGSTTTSGKTRSGRTRNCTAC